MGESRVVFCSTKGSKRLTWVCTLGGFPTYQVGRFFFLLLDISLATTGAPLPRLVCKARGDKAVTTVERALVQLHERGNQSPAPNMHKTG
jgi:hypothetical protein